MSILHQIDSLVASGQPPGQKDAELASVQKLLERTRDAFNAAQAKLEAVNLRQVRHNSKHPPPTDVIGRGSCLASRCTARVDATHGPRRNQATLGHWSSSPFGCPCGIGANTFLFGKQPSDFLGGGVVRCNSYTVCRKSVCGFRNLFWSRCG